MFRNSQERRLAGHGDGDAWGIEMHPKDSDIRDMIKDADKTKTGVIDFRAFVDVIVAKMSKMDSEAEITKAFNTFDKKDTGSLTVDELRRALTTMGDKLPDKDVCASDMFFFPLFSWHLVLHLDRSSGNKVAKLFAFSSFLFPI